MNALLELFPGFVLTLLTATLVVAFAYVPSGRSNPDHGFTCVTFSILLYFVIGLLRDVQLSLGLGFGLLAIFSLLNYRSNNIPVKDITYLFVCITLPLLNTFFVVTRITFPELILLNLSIFLVILVLERLLRTSYRPSKRVQYEKIDLILPQRYAELLEDLRTRTGLDVEEATVEEIDFLRDTAELRVYFREARPPAQRRKARE
jgi:hypothetical protein